MERGWPASALLITVVRDERGEGHAVLTARTMQGDFILDNKTDEIRVWHRTRYDFIMRQSYLNPRIWMSLDPKEADASLPSAGVRKPLSEHCGPVWRGAASRLKRPSRSPAA